MDGHHYPRPDGYRHSLENEDADQQQQFSPYFRVASPAMNAPESIHPSHMSGGTDSDTHLNNRPPLILPPPHFSQPSQQLELPLDPGVLLRIGTSQQHDFRPGYWNGGYYRSYSPTTAPTEEMRLWNEWRTGSHEDEKEKEITISQPTLTDLELVSENSTEWVAQSSSSPFVPSTQQHDTDTFPPFTIFEDESDDNDDGEEEDEHMMSGALPDLLPGEPPRNFSPAPDRIRVRSPGPETFARRQSQRAYGKPLRRSNKRRASTLEKPDKETDVMCVACKTKVFWKECYGVKVCRDCYSKDRETREGA